MNSVINNTVTSEEGYGISQICENPFLDARNAWKSPVPDLGLCVERTLLVWVPCGLLWICAPFYIILLRRRPYGRIPWTSLVYAKVMSSCVCLFSSATELIWLISLKSDCVPPAVLLAPVILLITHGLHLYMIYLGRRRAEQNSPLLWVFWLVMILCGIPQFFTSIHAIIYEPEKLPTVFILTFLLNYICSCILFVANCISDAPPKSQQLEDTKHPSPELQASFPSKLTYWWSFPIIWQGWRKSITEGDLWDVIPEDTIAMVSTSWNSAFNREKEKVSNPSAKLRPKNKTYHSAKVDDDDPPRINVSMFRMVWLTSRSSLAYILLFKIVSTVAALLTPQLLSFLINFTSDKSQPLWRGYLYATTLLVVCSVVSVAKGKLLIYEDNLSIKVCSALMAAVYQKALRLSGSARREFTVGQIINLMSVDAQAVGDAMLYMVNTVSSPTVALITIALLWHKIGPAVLAGVIFLILMIPLNSFLASKSSGILVSAMKLKDQRVKMVSEIISGMKVLKLYAWEAYFASEVESIRNQEMQLLKKASFLQAIKNFVFQLTPSLVATITFTTYLLVSEDNVLDAETAFVAIALFNMLRLPINILATVIDACIRANIAIKRMQKFMSSQEVDPTAICYDPSEDGDVVVHGGQFRWEAADGDASWQLKDVDLKITRGQLVAVVGTVGAGKSSLVLALLGEMKKDAGKVVINGRVAYVSQQAWLQNATLRDNITWGQPYDERRYQEIIKACALQQDLDMFPDGDMTEIGEKGINMSGGQKQRISLARAVYNDADIYLLDDPLSAVDAHVSRHIFDHVVGPNGLLKEKSRLLVTHALTFLPQVDEVVVMKDGQFVEKGCYVDLVAAGGNFSQFILQHITTYDGTDTEIELEELRGQLEEVPGGDVLLHQISQIGSICSISGAMREKEGTNSGERSNNVHHSFNKVPSENQQNRKKIRTTSENANHSEADLDVSFEYNNKSRSLYDIKAHSDELIPLRDVSVNPNVGHQRSSTSVPKSSMEALEDQKHDAKSFISSGIKVSTNNSTTKGNGQKLVEAEDSETGKVDRHLYFLYAKAMGFLNAFLPIFFVFLAQASIAGSNIWLSVWSSSETAVAIDKGSVTVVNSMVTNASSLNSKSLVISTDNSGSPSLADQESMLSRDAFLIGYSVFGLAQAAFMVVGMLLVTVGCLRAANKLHQSLLNTVVHLPMSFFDTNPSGRIITRFSKEINSLDVILPGFIRGALSYFMRVIVTMMVIVAAMPIAALFIVPIMVIYYFIQVVFVSTYRQLKRIESVTKSPVYTHFSETVQGVSIIRAFKRQEDFVNESLRRIERCQKPMYISFSCNRWLTVHLEMLGNFITFAAAVLAVVYRESISPGVVGLTVTYALSITTILNYLVSMSSDVEANIVAVERINEYVQREQEADWIIEENRPESSWPEQGRVVFNNFQTRYRPGLDLVLEGISCSFEPAEKVGIVGRTGAGKSSLTLALFRLIEAAGGDITIDDINIATIGLHDLRSQISIIPQDPVLFSGTLRLNLDPSGKHKDLEVWYALELAHLKDYVKTLPLGLQHVVDEAGSNFSVGQKQLVCLARALLRKSRILVLDEATAAVDLETDDFIQETIRDQFRYCTVITIAHRLNTIIDYDRVMVLDKGKVVEFDVPSSLLEKPHTIFYGMAKEAGLV